MEKEIERIRSVRVSVTSQLQNSSHKPVYFSSHLLPLSGCLLQVSRNLADRIRWGHTDRAVHLSPPFAVEKAE